MWALFVAYVRKRMLRQSWRGDQRFASVYVYVCACACVCLLGQALKEVERLQAEVAKHRYRIMHLIRYTTRLIVGPPVLLRVKPQSRLPRSSTHRALEAEEAKDAHR
jgi:hypothetical protein